MFTLLEPSSRKNPQSLCDCHNHRALVPCTMIFKLGRNKTERGYLTSLRENWESSTGQEVGFATFSSRLFPLGSISFRKFWKSH